MASFFCEIPFGNGVFPNPFTSGGIRSLRFMRLHCRRRKTNT